MANSTHVRGCSEPSVVATASEDVRLILPLNPTTSPSDEGCSRGAGVSRTAFLSFRLNGRGHRLSAPRVDMRLLP